MRWKRGAFGAFGMGEGWEVLLAGKGGVPLRWARCFKGDFGIGMTLRCFWGGWGVRDDLRWEKGAFGVGGG